jgi:hypothetical protein
VLKNIFPPVAEAAPEKEPKMEQLVTLLLEASALNRMVLVPEVDEELVLEMMSELPPVFKPSMVTWSAPFRKIRPPPLMEPEMTLAPLGLMAKLVQLLADGWFN